MRDFDSVFEGIEQTQDMIKNELVVLQAINDDLKKEWKKAKRFNIMMFVVAIVSLAIAVASLIITLG